MFSTDAAAGTAFADRTSKRSWSDRWDKRDKAQRAIELKLAHVLKLLRKNNRNELGESLGDYVTRLGTARHAASQNMDNDLCGDVHIDFNS